MTTALHDVRILDNLSATGADLTGVPGASDYVDWKKAYVKLREGQKIPEFLEGA